MKGGIVQILFALRTLRDLGLKPELTPLVFLNSDEEIGSRESDRYIRMLARRVGRTFVMEPAMGPDGLIKMRRKGVGKFTITVRGKAAHAGLDPEGGASAILELSHVIQQLFAMNDPQRGITVNVGTIDGGIRPNVIAPESTAVVDVRVASHEDAASIEKAILSLQPSTPRGSARNRWAHRTAAARGDAAERGALGNRAKYRRGIGADIASGHRGRRF